MVLVAICCPLPAILPARRPLPLQEPPSPGCPGPPDSPSHTFCSLGSFFPAGRSLSTDQELAGTPSFVLPLESMISIAVASRTIPELAPKVFPPSSETHLAPFISRRTSTFETPPRGRLDSVDTNKEQCIGQERCSLSLSYLDPLPFLAIFAWFSVTLSLCDLSFYQTSIMQCHGCSAVRGTCFNYQVSWLCPHLGTLRLSGSLACLAKRAL